MSSRANSEIDLSLITIDMAETLAVASRARAGNAVRGNATALPFADRSVDVVDVLADAAPLRRRERRDACFGSSTASRACASSSRDLRRSWLAAAGLWLASFPLGFHPVSRHDGVVSIMRGYTSDELRRLVDVGDRAHAYR